VLSYSTSNCWFLMLCRGHSQPDAGHQAAGNSAPWCKQAPSSSTSSSTHGGLCWVAFPRQDAQVSTEVLGLVCAAWLPAWAVLAAALVPPVVLVDFTQYPVLPVPVHIMCMNSSVCWAHARSFVKQLWNAEACPVALSVCLSLLQVVQAASERVCC
jgi:hypothetical protein